MAWNFGDVLDAIMPVLPPQHAALIHGHRRISWGELDRRSNNLARQLRAQGDLQNGAKIAFYMRNRPEYCEALAACWRGALTHVNVNYRYTLQELAYLFDNADAQVVLYGSEFRQQVEALRPDLPKVRLWVEIGDGAPLPDSLAYDALAQHGDGAKLEVTRSPQDLLFLYTGGTTGLPKGVMWEHDALSEAQMMSARALGPVPETVAELAAQVQTNGPGLVMIPACPLMHGTGLFTAMSVLLSGGTIVTLTDASFNAEELWRAVETHKVQYVSIVGDAFARPMVEALERAPKPYNLSSMVQLVSSGVMWSEDIKKRLLHFMPAAVLADAFGSSEAIGFGVSLMTKDSPSVQTAKFTIGEYCKVFDEQDREVAPGSGTPGIIAFGGPLPRGYYKDDAKTARTFKTIGGKRYAVPGDWCLVEKDGSLTLLGRGSACINSAGEKIFPEEVEESLKTHPHIADALVVGVPDAKWGECVTAVVLLKDGRALDADALKAHARAQLAGYKIPKHIVRSKSALRAPNGKADYKTARALAIAALAITDAQAAPAATATAATAPAATATAKETP